MIAILILLQRRALTRGMGNLRRFDDLADDAELRDVGKTHIPNNDKLFHSIYIWFCRSHQSTHKTTPRAASAVPRHHR